MIARKELSVPKRRTRAEVQQLVAEFVSTGMRRSEFCQSRGLSFSTLHRHLKKPRWKRRCKPISSADRLMAVELAASKSPKRPEPSIIFLQYSRPEDLWCSASAWVADVRDQSGSWDSSKVFSKLTCTPRTTRSAEANGTCRLLGDRHAQGVRGAVRSRPQSFVV